MSGSSTFNDSSWLVISPNTSRSIGKSLLAKQKGGFLSEKDIQAEVERNSLLGKCRVAEPAVESIVKESTGADDDDDDVVVVAAAAAATTSQAVAADAEHGTTTVPKFGVGGNSTTIVIKRKSSLSIRSYPKGSFFCLGNEFAERFSFYGMRAILTMYMKNIYNMADNDAKLVYHAFVSLAYFTPLFGSILADGCLGRYKVILYISVLYCLGHVILTMAAVPQFGEDVTQYLDFVGLFLIAFGTGGIKPCVSAFAADQFPPTMVAERRKFSSFFYFSITFGSLLAEAITPQLSYIDCLGKQFCYPLAFGLPAVFVFLGLVIFVAGKRYYKIVVLKENTLIKVMKCACYAARRLFTGGRCPKEGSWMDLAKDKYDAQLVEEVKLLGRNLLLFLPAVSFWALFDQQGSSWVLQANRMDGHFGLITILPDQLTFLNPFFVIIILPIFILVIYPWLWPRNMLVRPLRRMGYGCMFAILSFVAAGVVQLFINKSLVVMPEGDKLRYVLVNMGDDELAIDESTTRTFLAAYNHVINDLPPVIEMENTNTKNRWTFNYKNERNEHGNEKGRVIVFWRDLLNYSYHEFYLAKPIKGQSAFYALLHPDLASGNVSVLLAQDGIENPEKILTPNNSHIFVSPDFIGSTQYDIVLKACSTNDVCTKYTLITEQYLQNGGVYCLIVDERYRYQFITIVESNNISMAWMIPQYFLITIGEIMFAVSGSEFSYGQAASSMKSTWQACWLMSVAFGNSIDMVVSGSSLFDNAAIEYFFYACLMTAFTVVFVYLSRRYKYVDRDKPEAEKLEKLEAAAERPKEIDQQTLLSQKSFTSKNRKKDRSYLYSSQTYE